MSFPGKLEPAQSSFPGKLAPVGPSITFAYAPGPFALAPRKTRGESEGAGGGRIALSFQ